MLLPAQAVHELVMNNRAQIRFELSLAFLPAQAVSETYRIPSEPRRKHLRSHARRQKYPAPGSGGGTPVAWTSSTLYRRSQSIFWKRFTVARFPYGWLVSRLASLSLSIRTAAPGFPENFFAFRGNADALIRKINRGSVQPRC